jgi:hypothetical protein
MEDITTEDGKNAAAVALARFVKARPRLSLGLGRGEGRADHLWMVHPSLVTVTRTDKGLSRAKFCYPYIN